MFRLTKIVIFMSLILALSCRTENNTEVPPEEIPLQGRRPSEREIAKGVEKYILDALMKEFGFRFDVKEIKAFHIYEDNYRGFIHTNKVSLHHNMYSFWFESNGGYFYVNSWVEEYPGDIDDQFDLLKGLPFFKDIE